MGQKITLEHRRGRRKLKYPVNLAHIAVITGAATQEKLIRRLEKGKQVTFTSSYGIKAGFRTGFESGSPLTEAQEGYIQVGDKIRLTVE